MDNPFGLNSPNSDESKVDQIRIQTESKVDQIRIRTESKIDQNRIRTESKGLSVQMVEMGKSPNRILDTFLQSEFGLISPNC